MKIIMEIFFFISSYYTFFINFYFKIMKKKERRLFILRSVIQSLIYIMIRFLIIIISHMWTFYRIASWREWLIAKDPIWNITALMIGILGMIISWTLIIRGFRWRYKTIFHHHNIDSRGMKILQFINPFHIEIIAKISRSMFFKDPFKNMIEMSY
jgi:hypothetical protein